MVWAKLDDAILDNPKISRAGPLCFALHVAAVTWCCRNLSDGFIPIGRVGALLDFSTTAMSVHDGTEDGGSVPGVDWYELAKWLVDCELWHEEPGGYRLHDFLEYNPSRAHVLAEREAKTAAGRLGAQRRWGTRPARAIAPAKMADAMAGPMAPADQADSSRVADVLAKQWQGDAPDPVPLVVPPVSDPFADSSGINLRSDPCLGARPDWWAGVVETIEANVGEKLPSAEAWLRYDGHRAGKGITPNARDALYWLTTVMVPERRKDRDEAARRNAADDKRTAAFVQQRSGPEVKPQDSRKQFRERDEWERTAGPPDPETAAKMRALLGKVGT